VVDFYEFYEGLQEGWDGPALLVFSDGNHVGARLDRNGLRPARFWVTSDNHIFVASEACHCLAFGSSRCTSVATSSYRPQVPLLISIVACMLCSEPDTWKHPVEAAHMHSPV
jgi:hypothetical protein